MLSEGYRQQCPGWHKPERSCKLTTNPLCTVSPYQVPWYLQLLAPGQAHAFSPRQLLLLQQLQLHQSLSLPAVAAAAFDKGPCAPASVQLDTPQNSTCKSSICSITVLQMQPHTCASYLPRHAHRCPCRFTEGHTKLAFTRHPLAPMSPCVHAVWHSNPDG
jgi:hypothetical protein